eukprot:scaffold1916_cov294-Prasinococcus_capsulatus_cf.AAC.7
MERGNFVQLAHPKAQLQQDGRHWMELRINSPFHQVNAGPPTFAVCGSVEVSLHVRDQENSQSETPAISKLRTHQVPAVRHLRVQPLDEVSLLTLSYEVLHQVLPLQLLVRANE